jgi:hypothetical protein
MIFNFKQFINESFQDDLTDSSNFRNWFGNSVIIDNLGKPKIMYHGSPSMNINIFDINAKSINRTSNYAGFYFTPDKSVADFHKKEGKVYPCYLSIQNPIYLGSKYNPIKNEYTKFKYTPSQKALDYIYNKYKSEFNDDYLRSKLFDLKDRGVCSFMTGEDRRYIAIIDGYDGMIDGSEVCAFFPNQIKLADGTNITFDKNNPDLRK